jgi:predicted component of type VI protein secretion system
MSYDLLSFTSFTDFVEYLDGQIGQLKSKIEFLEKRYETLKSKADKVRKLETILSKLVGEQIRAINEVDFMGIRVVVSARALDELVAVEETLAALKDTLAALTRVREVVSSLAKETEVEKGGLSLIVQTINGIPVKLLFKESE